MYPDWYKGRVGAKLSPREELPSGAAGPEDVAQGGEL